MVLWCCEDKPALRSGDPAKSDAVEPDDGEIAAPSGKAPAPAITNQDLPFPSNPPGKLQSLQIRLKCT